MTIVDLQLKAQQVASALTKVQSDKNYWKSTAKPLLISTLVRVRELTQVNFNIDDSTNEVVELSMGINDNEPLGQLFFVLTYDGHLTVYARYITVEYGPQSKKTHYDRLATTETSAIDESFIYECVDKFLDTMMHGYITKVESKDAHDS